MGQLLRLFTQLSMAVEAMHGANILHRDLKPANVFLKKEVDADGEDVLDVKLGDFGLSRYLFLLASSSFTLNICWCRKLFSQCLWP